MGLVPFQQGPQGDLLPHFHHVRAQWEISSLPYKRESSAESDHAGTLMQDFQLPEPQQKNPTTPSLWKCVTQPKRLRPLSRGRCCSGASCSELSHPSWKPQVKQEVAFFHKMPGKFFSTFCNFSFSIFIYLFGRAGSYLWHVGSLVVTCGI